ncbi:hypothetical protein EG329_004822 [Mollisiaceae sp. DMI_Dod_QoI]|nr:hypothetical protein EG329_004822 [Helotiales sp. DMI_Dod_QoI]
MATQSLYADIDDASAALILQLQIEDALNIINRSPTPGNPVSAVSDGRAALELLKAERERETALLQDRRFALDFHRPGTVANSPEIAARFQPQPTVATQPSAPSQELRQNVPIEHEEISTLANPPTSANDSSLANSPPLIVSQDNTSGAETPIDFPPTGDADDEQNSQVPTGRTLDRCVSCDNFLFKWERDIDIPCNHNYCGPCIEQLFSQSLIDESLFPPRCCKQSIPVDNVQQILSHDFIKNFQDKKQEIETVNHADVALVGATNVRMRLSILKALKKVKPVNNKWTLPWKESICIASTRMAGRSRLVHIDAPTALSTCGFTLWNAINAPHNGADVALSTGHRLVVNHSKTITLRRFTAN